MIVLPKNNCEIIRTEKILLQNCLVCDHCFRVSFVVVILIGFCTLSLDYKAIRSAPKYQQKSERVSDLKRKNLIDRIESTKKHGVSSLKQIFVAHKIIERSEASLKTGKKRRRHESRSEFCL